jgi:hypothetical protein
LINVFTAILTLDLMDTEPGCPPGFTHVWDCFRWSGGRRVILLRYVGMSDDQRQLPLLAVVYDGDDLTACGRCQYGCEVGAELADGDLSGLLGLVGHGSSCGSRLITVPIVYTQRKYQGFGKVQWVGLQRTHVCTLLHYVSRSTSELIYRLLADAELIRDLNVRPALAVQLSQYALFRESMPRYGSLRGSLRGVLFAEAA